MSEIKVTFVEPNGKERIVEDAAVDSTLMEVAMNNDIEGILGDCGGACACATCHVLIADEWREAVGGPDDVEDMTLEMAGDFRRENSRLGCQVRLGPEHDGLKVTVEPVEF